MIYLDWAATALPSAAVIDAMAAAARECFGNPSSPYEEGKKARTALDDARSRCARVLDCEPAQLTFTSGGTESNAIALLSKLLVRKPGTIIHSGIEHPSVTEPIRTLEVHGWSIKALQPDTDGIIRPDRLARLLKKNLNTRLVSIIGVSNEIGAIQPIEELTAVTRDFQTERGRPIHFHADLVQAAGKIPINLTGMDVDSAAFSAHKFRGPRGMGLFYHRQHQFDVLHRGGGQESGIRPGTENVAGAIGMALALELYGQPAHEVRENGEWLLQQLLKMPEVSIIPESRVSVNNPLYVPGIIPLTCPPIPGEVLARVLAESGYAISTGSACSNNRRGKKTGNLAALGISDELVTGMIRISLGGTTRREDLVGFIKDLRTHITTFRNY